MHKYVMLCLAGMKKGSCRSNVKAGAAL
jgi:hypothetical protein